MKNKAQEKKENNYFIRTLFKVVFSFSMKLNFLLFAFMLITVVFTTHSRESNLNGLIVLEIIFMIIISLIYTFHYWRKYLNKIVFPIEFNKVIQPVIISLIYYLFVFIILYRVSDFRLSNYMGNLNLILILPYSFLFLFFFFISPYIFIILQIFIHFSILFVMYIYIKKRKLSFNIKISSDIITLLLIFIVLIIEYNNKKEKVISNLSNNVEVMNEYKYKIQKNNELHSTQIFYMLNQKDFKNNIKITAINPEKFNLSVLSEFPETMLWNSIRKSVNNSIVPDYIIDGINSGKLSNTIDNYKELIHNNYKHMIIGIEPTKEIIDLAKNENVKLSVTTIGKEALVFYVNDKNPVNNLTIGEISNIYSGKIKNWKKINGFNKNIIAFQREENTESQLLMNNMIMNNKKIINSVYMETNNAIPMLTMIDESIADYHNYTNAIGYSLRYYPRYFNPMKNIKLISIEGVEPTNENIINDKYPLSVNICVVTIGDHTKEVKDIIDWLLTNEGQNAIEELGLLKIK